MQILLQKMKKSFCLSYIYPDAAFLWFHPLRGGTFKANVRERRASPQSSDTRCE